jgi:hypothetical protein
MVNDLVIETSEPSPQQESGDASKSIDYIFLNLQIFNLVALANSSDIPKQIFLCIVANDKKVKLIAIKIHLNYLFLVNNDST